MFQKVYIWGCVQILDGTFHWQDKRKMEIRWKSWLDSSLFPSGWSIDKMEKQLMTYLIGLCIKTYKKLFTVWWSSLRMRSDPLRPYEVLTTMPPCLWSVTPSLRLNLLSCKKKCTHINWVFSAVWILYCCLDFKFFSICLVFAKSAGIWGTLPLAYLLPPMSHPGHRRSRFTVSPFPPWLRLETFIRWGRKS